MTRGGPTSRYAVAATAALLAASVLLLIAAAGAAAEVCSDDGDICLESDVSSPVIPPQTLQFKVASQWSTLQVELVGPSLKTQLVEPGGLGGMSTWNADFHWVNPGEEHWADGTYSMIAIATMPPFPANEHSAYAAFAVPVLAPVVNEAIALRRKRNRFVASFSFQARRELTAVTAFSVPGEANSGIVSVRQAGTAAGAQTQTARYGLRRLRRLQTCRSAWSHGATCPVQAVGFATPENVGTVTPAAALANADAFSRVLEVPKPRRHRR